MPKEAGVGIAEALVPEAAESAGAEEVAVSWLVVELDEQAASNSVLLKPAASKLRRGEMGMEWAWKLKDVHFLRKYAPFAAYSHYIATSPEASCHRQLGVLPPKC